MSSLNPKAMALLEHKAPVISAAEAELLLLEQYGIKGSVQTLVSERDLNFRVAANGTNWLLKFSNAAEPLALTEFQTSVMAHLHEHCPNVTAQFALPDRNGNTLNQYQSANGEGNTVRLLHWVPGIPVRDTEQSGHQANAMGRMLADVGAALENFSHSADRPDLLWDMQQCDQLLSFADTIVDSDLRSFCSNWLGNFVTETLPKLQSLRTQVIYNDLNHSNVLANPEAPNEITGLIDFGDVLRAPLIIDVAVACAYLCKAGSDPYQSVRDFLTGYEGVRALQSQERHLLHDLIQTRMVMTIVITNWRASRHPENREYILRNESHARSMLLQLNKIGQDEAFAAHLKYLEN